MISPLKVSHELLAFELNYSYCLFSNNTSGVKELKNFLTIVPNFVNR